MKGPAIRFLRGSFESISEEWRAEQAAKAGFSDGTALKCQLYYEKRRSLRQNQPLSAVEIDFHSAFRAPLNETSSLKKKWKSLLGLIARAFRETDLRFCDGAVLTVLLPNTSGRGASRACERLRALIHSELSQGSAGDSSLEIAAVEVPNVEVAPGTAEASPGEGELNRSATASNGSRWPPISPRRNSASRFSLAAKRGIDLFGALVGLLLGAPLALLMAAGIKLTSPGPILYRQTRIGRRGRPFNFLKFRTMKFGVDDQIHREYVSKLIRGRDPAVNLGTWERPLFKVKDDPRVTAFGAFLRRWSLDELPQFLNVIAGDMSLVGPRPPVPYEFESYQRWHLQRLEVKPGMSGLWQVKGRSRTTFDEMIRLDLQYIHNWSLLLDVQILARTFGAVCRGEGAV